MPSFLDLAAELQWSIAELLELESSAALLNLSCTCRRLRELVAPSLFKCITLRNNEKSGRSVQALADGPYKDSVRRLHYQGIIALPPDYIYRNVDDGPEPAPSEEDLPSSVEGILSGLDRFPNLETLVVEFPFDEEDWQSAFFLFDRENHGEVIKEKKSAWGTLMTRSYEAVAQNSRHSIKAFELRNLVPCYFFPWQSRKFQNFLSAVERFTISLRGNDNGAGWMINTLNDYLYDYLGLLADLDVFFFDHLTSATHLCLIGTRSGLPGLGGTCHALPLKVEQMPHLQTLQLSYVFIDSQLSDFVNGHSGTLEQIRLDNCFSGATDFFAENGISWAEFFNTIAKTNPSKLKELIIHPLDVPLTDSQEWGREETEEEVNTDVQRTRTILKEDPRKRLFAYDVLDDKYGMLFADTAENVAAFLRGDDQRAYDALDAIVKRNILEI